MHSLLKTILAVLFILLLLSLMSLMMVFNGLQDPQLQTLLRFQNLLLLPTLVISLVGLIAYFISLGLQQGLGELWARTPGWLLFAVVIINSLVFSGFFAFNLVRNETGLNPGEHESVPLLACLLTSLAFVIIYSHLRHNNPPSTFAQRNKARGSKPIIWKK